MVYSIFPFAYILLAGLSKPCKGLLSTLLCTVILAVSGVIFTAIVVLVFALRRIVLIGPHILYGALPGLWLVPHFIWRPHSTGVFSLCAPVCFISSGAQCSYFVLYGATILIGVHCYYHLSGLKGN